MAVSYNCSMAQSWTIASWTVSHSISGRTVTVTCSLHLWRNDGVDHIMLGHQ